MARYAILNTIDWDGCRRLADGALEEEEVMQRLTGCAWLFRVDDGVESVEEAARAVVSDFLASEGGRRVLASEETEFLSWEDAIGWISDEQWAAAGLEPIRHPDVERVVVDAGERLGPARLPRHPRPS
jgi:hypothetical protein